MATAKKKPAAKKPAAKKTTAKKPTAKKKVAKKPATKKAAPKKKVAKKTTAKKATVKKPAAKKKVAKKPAAKKPTKKVVKKATVKKAAKKPATKRKPNAAFMKPMTPSPALGAIVGDKALPRTEVTKKVWAYIKKNNLQDPKNKRDIIADDKLKVVFGGKAKVNMFEMTKLISKHLS